MPKLSDEMAEGTIRHWKKKEGERVEPGEAIAEVETSKANLDVESIDGGVLLKQLAKEGQTVKIGVAIAVIGEAGESVEGMVAGMSPSPSTTTSASTAAAAVAAKATETMMRQGVRNANHDVTPGRVKASPLARRIARERGVDITRVQGSGPSGRIIRADVDQEIGGKTAPTAAAVDREVELSQMRKAIAKRMTESKPGVPHFYLTADIDMARAMDLRAQLKEIGTQASVNDLVLRACVVALGKHPQVNASYRGETFFISGAVHLGVAVAIDEGLITPVIRDAQRKSIAQLGTEARELAEQARARKLKPAQYEGGTFTVSNLGMFGIREFSAIINPPQAAILAVGAVEKRAVVVGDALTVGTRMTVTLSGDHRVIDGATGAKFLQTLRESLEQPLRMVL